MKAEQHKYLYCVIKQAKISPQFKFIVIQIMERYGNLVENTPRGDSMTHKAPSTREPLHMVLMLFIEIVSHIDIPS